MLPINDPRITIIDGAYSIQCKCGNVVKSAIKSTALKVAERGSCLKCKKDYRTMRGIVAGLYQRSDKKWCSKCPNCNKEQAYTRKDHAKQSTIAGWKCKACTAALKGFSANQPIGHKKRLYNQFAKSAKNRRMPWEISEEEMFEPYTGTCALTGWEISISYDSRTASLDRIDNSKGYIKGNIQWVHTMVNMCRNKYTLEKFIEMCKSVASKW